MEEQIISQELPPLTGDVEVVDIQFRPGQKIYFFDPNGGEFLPGDHVIIDTARGAEFGTVTGGNHMIAAKDVVAPLRCVLRKATEQDGKLTLPMAINIAHAAADGWHTAHFVNTLQELLDTVTLTL